ncbi:MAG TPA: hypothetical protein ACQGQH_06555 [Xylella sp.]
MSLLLPIFPESGIAVYAVVHSDNMSLIHQAGKRDNTKSFYPHPKLHQPQIRTSSRFSSDLQKLVAAYEKGKNDVAVSAQERWNLDQEQCS